MTPLLSYTSSRPIVCEHCKGYIRAGTGLGSRGTYCRAECWFQAAADEYKAAALALGVEPMGALGPIEPLTVDEIMDAYDAGEAGYMCGWCQTMHYDPCEMSREAQAQLNELRDLASASEIERAFELGDEVYIYNPNGIDHGMIGTIDQISGDRYRVRIDANDCGSWWSEDELESVAARADYYGEVRR